VEVKRRVNDIDKERRPLHKVIFSLIISILILSGCTNASQETGVKKEALKKPPAIETNEKSIHLPIEIPEGEFSKLIGWIGEDRVIYLSNLQDGANVYSYNLNTGESKLLYVSEFPIVTAHISPLKNYLAIHSSPSTYEGIITILDTEGAELWSESLPSVEISLEWNPYNESDILISAFNEDWSYKTFLLDITGSEMKEVSSQQPFFKWIDQNKVAYLDWDESSPSFFAPLVSKDMNNEKKQTMFEEVFQFTSYIDRLLIINVNKEDPTIAHYSFLDKDLNELTSFSVPQLSRFSDWLVPFNDYHEKKHRFLTFRPLKSAEADAYTDGFQLVSYNTDSGSNKVLIDKMDNEPIKCSPAGEICLYGFRFEKLINLQTKKITNIYAEE
jgi:hypothetical protein